VVALLEGGVWAEALRIACLRGRTDLVETHLLPQLLESHRHYLSLLPSLSSDLSRHSQRLQLVRDTKRKQQEAILDGSCAVDERDADLFSDSSSVTTGRSATTSLASSRTSGKSGKNRRKAANRRWSLREGSRHEDLALVEAVSTLCGTVDHLQDEVPSLLQTLLLYGHAHEARQLHSSFTALLDSAEIAIEKVWPRQQATPTNTQLSLVTGPHMTVNRMLTSIATSPPSATDTEASFPRPQLRDTKAQLKISTLLKELDHHNHDKS
jgi:elongator complex protein 1